MPKPLTKEQNKVLNEVYYEDGVMVGRDRLWEYMKENHPEMKISQRQVGSFVANQEVAQINQRAKSARDIKTSLYTTRGNIAIDLKDNQKLAGETNNQFKYIFVAIDMFTRFVYAVPMKDKTDKLATEAMEAIYNQVQAKGKTKMSIRSDQGSEFTNDLFKKFLKRKNITQVLSSAGTPHSNGMVEKANDIIGRLISKLTLADKSFNWARSINKITGAINSTPNKTLGISPNNMEKLVKEGKQEELNAIIQTQSNTKSKARAVAKQEFVVGDKARLYIFQEDQKYKQRNWSREVYDITKVRKPKTEYGTYTYKLDGIDQYWQGHELLKINAVENEKEADDKDLFEVSRIVSLRILNGLPAYEVAYKGYRKKSDNRIVLKSDVIQTYARAELEEKKLKQRFRQSASGNWRVEKVQ